MERGKSNDNTHGPRAGALLSLPEQVKDQGSYQGQIGEIYILRRWGMIVYL